MIKLEKDESNIINEEKQEDTSKKYLKIFLEYFKVIVITFVCCFVFLQLFQISKVVGTSMESNYYDGDIVLINKAFYNNPSYNDIVVADYEEADHTEIIKRIIGVSGDKIEIKDNQLYRNGTLLEEDYIKEPMVTDDLSVTVGKGEVFIMGDNRNVSLDSRRLGCFKFDDDIIGKVIFRLSL